MLHRFFRAVFVLVIDIWDHGKFLSPMRNSEKPWYCHLCRDVTASLSYDFDAWGSVGVSQSTCLFSYEATAYHIVGQGMCH